MVASNKYHNEINHRLIMSSFIRYLKPIMFCFYVWSSPWCGVILFSSSYIWSHSCIRPVCILSLSIYLFLYSSLVGEWRSQSHTQSIIAIHKIWAIHHLTLAQFMLSWLILQGTVKMLQLYSTLRIHCWLNGLHSCLVCCEYQ